jgi:hypothetical protein
MTHAFSTTPIHHNGHDGHKGSQTILIFVSLVSFVVNQRNESAKSFE